MKGNYSKTVLEMLRYDLSEDEVNKVKATFTDNEWELYFNIISLKREHQLNTLDIHGRFDENKINWEYNTPIIDIALQSVISNKKDEFKIIFTHDIDWITPTEPLSILKSVINRQNWIPATQCLNYNLFYNNLIKTWEYEKLKGIKSTNFFIADKYGIGRYDTRYSTKWGITRKTILKCEEMGHYVGLHGSYYAKDNDSYKTEKNKLEKIINHPIKSHRNHYLRFDTKSGFNQLEKAGFEYDYSIGYITKAGFRAGTSKQYHPYNWETNTISKIKEIPLLIMERLSYLEDMNLTLSNIETLLNQVKRNNGCVAILTHPDLFLVNNLWWEFYKKVIDLSIRIGADVRGERDE